MGGKPQILVVDDELRGVELAARTLRNLGEVETATSSEIAMELLRARDFDVVISDERMPGMSGVQLLAEVAERQPQTGRILLTGYADIDASIGAINRARVHAYLGKPCPPNQLRVTVEGVLERVQLARANAALLVDLEATNRELASRNEQLSATLASLREAQEAALEAERLSAIAAIAASVVHDLRGPITLITSSGRELCSDAALARGDVEELSGGIVEEAERMARMCGELLESTRPSAGPAERREEDLDAVLESAAAALTHDASAAGVSLETDLRASVRMAIDEDRFRRAILNLGYNAIEAMPEGGRLELAARREADAVVVSVRDTGVGIPEEIAANVFEPFFTSGKQRGTGLGLAIVRKVVREHGGAIAVGKAEGGGTAFDLRFPLPDAS